MRPLGMLGFGVVLAISACRSESAPDYQVGSIEALLTAEVGDQLDRDGLLPQAVALERGDISAAAAVELVRSYVATFGTFYVGRWAEERGAPIAGEVLAPCGPPRLARSPYVPLDETYSAASRSLVGAWWLIAMCEGETPTVIIAVSTAATDYEVRNGQLNVPWAAAEIRSVGAPVGELLPLLRSPEAVVRQVHAESGRRIASIPRLWSGRVEEGGPFASVWEVELEAPVRCT